MKCRVCGGKAVARLPYANLALCRDHFVEFFERRVWRTVERFRMIRRGETVAVAVSGGKDSLALLHVLAEKAEEKNIQIIGITIDLGISGYSEPSVRAAVEAYEKLGVEYRVVRLRDEYGFGIDDVRGAKVGRSVCSVCGVAKRYVLNRVAREVGADKLATGHNLDDFLSVVMSLIVRGDVEGLARQNPAQPSVEGFVPRIKPLVETPEKDVLLYALLRGIRFFEGECPYARGAVLHTYKRALNLIEDMHPSMKQLFLRSFVSRLRPVFSQGFSPKPLLRCSVCGEPSSSDPCQFCRISSRVLGVRRVG